MDANVNVGIDETVDSIYVVQIYWSLFSCLAMGVWGFFSSLWNTLNRV